MKKSRSSASYRPTFWAKLGAFATALSLALTGSLSPAFAYGYDEAADSYGTAIVPDETGIYYGDYANNDVYYGIGQEYEVTIPDDGYSYSAVEYPIVEYPVVEYPAIDTNTTYGYPEATESPALETAGDSDAPELIPVDRDYVIGGRSLIGGYSVESFSLVQYNFGFHAEVAYAEQGHTVAAYASDPQGFGWPDGTLFFFEWLLDDNLFSAAGPQGDSGAWSDSGTDEGIIPANWAGFVTARITATTTDGRTQTVVSDPVPVFGDFVIVIPEGRENARIGDTLTVAPDGWELPADWSLEINWSAWGGDTQGPTHLVVWSDIGGYEYGEIHASVRVFGPDGNQLTPGYGTQTVLVEFIYDPDDPFGLNVRLLDGDHRQVVLLFVEKHFPRGDWPDGSEAVVALYADGQPVEFKDYWQDVPFATTQTFEVGWQFYVELLLADLHPGQFLTAEVTVRSEIDGTVREATASSVNQWFLVGDFKIVHEGLFDNPVHGDRLWVEADGWDIGDVEIQVDAWCEYSVCYWSTPYGVEDELIFDQDWLDWLAGAGGPLTARINLFGADGVLLAENLVAHRYILPTIGLELEFAGNGRTVQVTSTQFFADQWPAGTVFDAVWNINNGQYQPAAQLTLAADTAGSQSLTADAWPTFPPGSNNHIEVTVTVTIPGFEPDLFENRRADMDFYVDPGITRVTLSPATATLRQGDTPKAFTADVVASWTTPDYLVWGITSNVELAEGTRLTPSGNSATLYVAPDQLPGTITITATSFENPLVTDNATVTVIYAPAITGFLVTPTNAVIPRGTPAPFHAAITTVSGASDAVREWLVEPYGTTPLATGTTINPETGVLTVAADQVPGYLSVVAIADFDGSREAVTATVTLNPQVSSVSITERDVQVLQGESHLFKATIDQTDIEDSVVWTVSGNTDAGTIIGANSGLLAVATGETAEMLTVTATSVFNPGAYDRVPVVIDLAPAITEFSITPTEATIIQGGYVQFTAHIHGVGGATEEVIWTVEGEDNGTTIDPETGYLSISINQTTGIEVLTVTATPVFGGTAINPAPAPLTAIVTVNYAPAVRAITVTGPTTALRGGSPAQYLAYANAVGGASEGVLWQLADGSVAVTAGTRISNTGVLIVDADQPVGTIAVIAVSDDPRFGTVSSEPFMVTVNYNPRATGIVVSIPDESANSVAVQPGDPQQFLAKVVGFDNPDQAVIWTVVGSGVEVAEDTKIDADGLLQVATNQGVGSLFVRATTIAAPQVSGSFLVHIPSVVFGVSSAAIDPIPVVQGTSATAIFVVESNQGATVETAASLVYSSAFEAFSRLAPGYQISLNPEPINQTVTGAGLLATEFELTVSVDRDQRVGLLTVALASDLNSAARDQVVFEIVYRQQILSATASLQPALIRQGDTVPFSYLLNAVGGASADVDWEVEGASEGTTLEEAADTQFASLIIDQNQVLGLLTVRATSVFDNSFTYEWVLDVRHSDGVIVSPSLVTLIQGASHQFAANVYTDGELSTEINWTVGSDAVEGTSIDYDGLLTLSPNQPIGTLTVVATSAEFPGRSATAVVTVTARPRVTEVTVTSSDDDVIRGGTVQFTAEVTTVGGASTDVTWAITSPAGTDATIDEDGLLTVGPNHPVGPITVTATPVFVPQYDDELFTDSATVTVYLRPRVTEVTVTASDDDVIQGGTVQFTADVTTVDGASTDVTWAITSPAGTDATIDEDGLLTVGPNHPVGPITVTATPVFVSQYDAVITGSATVTVYYRPQVTGISVTPALAELLQGDTAQFAATVTQLGGAPTDVEWSMAGADEGTTLVGGLLSVDAAQEPGVITVTATSVFDSAWSANASVLVCLSDIDETLFVSHVSAGCDPAALVLYSGQITEGHPKWGNHYAAGGRHLTHIAVPLVNFQHVTDAVTGTEVAGTNYVLTSGSTVVAFTESFLTSLKGNHTFNINFYHTGTGAFSIPVTVVGTGSTDTEDNNDDDSDNDGGNNQPVIMASPEVQVQHHPATGVWLLPLALAATLGLGGVTAIRNSKKRITN